MELMLRRGNDVKKRRCVPKGPHLRFSTVSLPGRSAGGGTGMTKSLAGKLSIHRMSGLEK
jgi:hypothetical protein